MRSPIVLLALAGAVVAQEAAAEPAVVAERPVFQPYGPASSLRAYVEQFADGFGRFSPSNAKKAAKVGDGETFSYGALCSCSSVEVHADTCMHQLANGQFKSLVSILV